MIRTRVFNWATRGPGGPGWLVEGAPEGWYPGPGFLAAHDTMEHLSNKPDWAHELRAAGVAAFDVKGMRHRTFDSIAEDVVSFAARDYNFEVPPAPARWSKPLPKFYENKVQALATAMRDTIDHGMAKALEDPTTKHDVPEAAKANAPHFVDKALPWIRLGFAGAARVYAKHTLETGRLIDQLASAVNDDHNKLPPVKGDKLTVTVDTKAHTFTLKRSGNEKMDRHERLMGSFFDTLEGLVGGR